MTRIGRHIVRAAAAAVGLFGPASFHSAATERAFTEAQDRRYTTQRRVGIFLALAIWVAYFASDIFDTYRGPNPGADLREVLLLRGLGALVVAIGSLFSLGRWFGRDRHAQALILPIFMLLFLLVMRISAIQDAPDPGSSDSGLMVTLLFLVAFFRLRSTTVTALLTACFALRVLIFPFLTTPASDMFVSLRAFDAARYLHILRQPSFFLSFFDMLCFALAGSVIAGELERGDRAAFGREHELADANLDLLESRRDAEGKAAALVAAKEDLLALATQSSLDKSKFMADAAHDLAQPIHAVSLLIEAARLALDRRDIEGAQILIRDAGRAAQVARSSFKAVLDVSRLETGLATPAYSVFDVNSLVAEVVLSLEAVARDRGVVLHARPSRLRPLVRSDRILLGRMLGNLADNAIKYAAPGRPRRWVVVAVTTLADRVRVSVIDNGVGIPEPKQAEVFKPFIQLGNPSRDRDQGLGLGLSIVAAGIRALAEHEISLRSGEGLGTRISIEAPRSAAAQAAHRLDVSYAPALAEMSSLFVWLVETDVAARTATRALLDASQVLTLEVANPERLQDVLAISERRPDLIIWGAWPLDGQGAKEALALLSEHWGSGIPMLVLSEAASGDDVDRPSADIAHLRKPVEPEDLLRAITRLCFPIEQAAGVE